MHLHRRIIVVSIVITILFSACNTKPDHRRYIPKDAALVAGVNLSALGKKIAWNMITGSKLFKEMEKKVPQKNGGDVMSGIDKAGIDVMNTFYVYMKTDKRFSTGMKVTAIIPLSDAGSWEAYVKKNFPNAEIKDQNGIKATSLDPNMYMGWKKNVLIVMNVFSTTGENAPISPDMAAELDNAFAVTDEHSIKADKNFELLEGSGHDATLWINYNQIMNQYNDGMANRMGGMALSRSLWKETAIACGFDFKKGKISADMTYYTPKNFSDIYKDFGSASASKDMVDRLSGKDLDMLVTTHVSMKGVKTMLDSTGVLGLINTSLAGQGINADNILNAFTGDMAFTVNSLSLKFPGNGAKPAGEIIEPQRSYDMCYVLKINNKENFQKLLSLSIQSGLQPYGTGYAIRLNPQDSLFVMANDQYAVLSNKYESGSAILTGSNKEKLATAVGNDACSHPMAMFFDINQSLKNIDTKPMLTHGSDSSMYEVCRHLLTNVSITGGEFKNDAVQAHLDVNFANSEENSIITLLDFGMKISEAQEKYRNGIPKQQDASF